MTTQTEADRPPIPAHHTACALPLQLLALLGVEVIAVVESTVLPSRGLWSLRVLVPDGYERAYKVSLVRHELRVFVERDPAPITARVAIDVRGQLSVSDVDAPEDDTLAAGERVRARLEGSGAL